MRLALAFALISVQARLAAAFVPSSMQSSTDLRIYTGYSGKSHHRLLAAPEPLASEGDWTAYLDEETTGLIYYFNGKTGESRWEPPTKTFPSVAMAKDTREMAETKRLEYIKEARQSDKEKQGILFTVEKRDVKEAEKEEPKWFSRLFQEAEVEKEEKEKEEPNWFDFLFKEKEADAATATLESSVVTEEPEKKGLFGGMFEKDAEQVMTKATETVTTAVPTEIIVPKEEKKAVKIEMAAYVLPHPAKIFWGGEDAVFTQGRTFGVFDGVSGAAKLDGVPLYSKTLAIEMRKLVSDQGLNVQDLTKRLNDAAETADKTSTGASTAIVASVSNDGFLRVLNLGDSACIVVRNNRVVTRTREISHYFDCPYQLSLDSPDRPRDGTKLNLELLPGDLIIMGSDGIFDNLADESIVEIAASGPNRPQAIAKRISDRSRKVSLNKKAETPYAVMAKKAGDPDYEDGVGGKVDDVSCIVVRYE